MKITCFSICIWLLLQQQTNLVAQAGTLDPSFNGTGIINMKVDDVMTDFGRVRLQPDGKILSMGFKLDDTHIQAIAMRFLSDGSTDPSFGNNGIFSTLNDWPYYIGFDGLLQPDGKILIVADVAYKNEIALIRLLPDGTPDPDFGINGVASNHIDILLYSPVPQRAFFQPDGKIIIVGYYKDINTDIKRAFVMRLMPDGFMDPSFADAGIKAVIPSDPAWSLEFKGGKTQPDGRIVISGRFKGLDTSNETWYVVRLLPNGDYDPSFDDDGVVAPNIGSLFSEGASEIHLMADGRIVAAGYGQKLPGQHFTMIRFKTDGSLDNSFGLGGKAQIDFGCCHSYIHDIVEQPDGKLVVCGYSDHDNISKRFSVARVKPNGFVDLEFGTDGKVLIPIDNNTVFAAASTLALQPDGKIVISGYTADSNGYALSGLMVRLNPTGSIDTYTPFSFNNYQLELSPNPVSGAVLDIRYALPESQTVTLRIFDVLGRNAADLISAEPRPEGPNHESITLPRDLPAGEYYLKMETKTGSQLTKLIKLD